MWQVLGVLSGFFVIAVVVAVGYLLAHLGVFTEQTQNMLGTLSFYVAMPVLFVTMLAGEDVTALLSVDLVASLVSIAAIIVVWVVAVRFVWRLPMAETVTGAFASAYVNAGNLGLPIATYVLGSPTRVVPVMLTQLLFLQPLGLALLDLSTGSEAHFTVRAFIGRFFRNPLTIATLIGVLLSVTGTSIPPLLAAPLTMVGAMAVPGILMAFGISLRLGPRPDRAAGPMLGFQVLLKLVAMPLVAWVFGRFVMHLDGTHLLAVTVMAGLPTAQNVFVVATTYGRGVVMARDAIFVSTVLSVLSIFGIAALLS